MKPPPLLLSLLLFWISGPALQPQDNPRFTLSIDGPCGETTRGSAEELWDDGTGGARYFFDRDAFTLPDFPQVPNDRPGHTLEVILRTENNPTVECDPSMPRPGTDPPRCDFGAQGWSFGLTTEGPLVITDVTTVGTRSTPICFRSDIRNCVLGAPFVVSELTGPPLALPDGRVVQRAGPPVPGNAGALSVVMLNRQGLIELPPEGPAAVLKIRVFGRFPDEVGESSSGRIVFAPRAGSEEEVSNAVTFMDEAIDETSNPPLVLSDCEIRLEAAPPAGAFIRCDPNDDTQLNIADAVWILSELFRGGPETACSEAADCNADSTLDISDAVYALSYQFTGGQPPPAPFPDCGRVEGITAEECPEGSTTCHETSIDEPFGA